MTVQQAKTIEKLSGGRVLNCAGLILISLPAKRASGLILRQVCGYARNLGYAHSLDLSEGTSITINLTKVR